MTGLSERRMIAMRIAKAMPMAIAVIVKMSVHPIARKISTVKSVFQTISQWKFLFVARLWMTIAAKRARSAAAAHLP